MIRTVVVSLCVIALMMSLSVPVILGVSTSGDCMETKEVQVINLVNDYRAANGLGPLSSSDDLSASAEHMVQNMSHYDYVGHVMSNGTTWADNQRNHGYWYNTWRGQNVAGGQATASDVVNAWKNSPPHNANLLAPDAVRIGVGYTTYPGSTYYYYWSLDLGGYPDGLADRCA